MLDKCGISSDFIFIHLIYQNKFLKEFWLINYDFFFNYGLEFFIFIKFLFGHLKFMVTNFISYLKLNLINIDMILRIKNSKKSLNYFFIQFIFVIIFLIFSGHICSGINRFMIIIVFLSRFFLINHWLDSFLMTLYSINLFIIKFIIKLLKFANILIVSFIRIIFSFSSRIGNISIHIQFLCTIHGLLWCHV